MQPPPVGILVEAGLGVVKRLQEQVAGDRCDEGVDPLGLQVSQAELSEADVGLVLARVQTDRGELLSGDLEAELEHREGAPAFRFVEVLKYRPGDLESPRVNVDPELALENARCAVLGQFVLTEPTSKPPPALARRAPALGQVADLAVRGDGDDVDTKDRHTPLDRVIDVVREVVVGASAGAIVNEHEHRDIETTDRNHL